MLIIEAIPILIIVDIANDYYCCCCGCQLGMKRNLKPDEENECQVRLLLLLLYVGSISNLGRQVGAKQDEMIRALANEVVDATGFLGKRISTSCC